MKKKLLVLILMLSFLFSSNFVNAHPILTKNRSFLYVGGTGPENFTTIQNAINASTDGDIIFVFQKSEPYLENIKINKSISLIALDNASIGSATHDINASVVEIMHNNVNFCGFSFVLSSQDCPRLIFAKNSSFINISRCYMEKYQVGIFLDKVNESSITNTTFNSINYIGLILTNSNKNLIKNNKFYQNSAQTQIMLQNNSATNIIENNNLTTIYFCCLITLWKSAGKGNEIIKNNIFGPVKSGVKSYWNANYFYDWIGLKYKRLEVLPKIIVPAHTGSPYIINFDWHPVSKPYTIN